MLLARRFLIGTAVVAFWLTMTAWLAWRELAVAPLAPAEARAESAELGIYLTDGTPVGHLSWRQTPATRDGRDGVGLAVDAELALELLGKTTALALAGEAWRPLEGEEATFRFDVRSGEHTLAVAGALADGELRADVETGGETIGVRRRLAGGWAPSIGLGTLLRLPPLEVGRSYRLASFDPLTLGAGTARVRCLAREVREVGGREIATHVVEIETSGLRSRAWVDETGAVVRAETPLGLVFELLPPGGEAQTPAAAPSGGDLLARTAVEPRGIAPFRGARRLEIAIGGLDETLTIPLGGSQIRTGPGRYRLRTAAMPTGEAVEALAETATPAALAPYLAAGPFIQADHPRIRALAEEIVGGARGPWQRASALGDWVYTSLEKEIAASVPSALEVLRTRRGDCNEHAVLFAALARAAGVPTRIAIGLVWSDELEAFYYHAWPEVWIDGWIGIDPTLGQAVADATHLRLLDGGIEAWPRLLPYLGRIEVEVLEVE